MTRTVIFIVFFLIVPCYLVSQEATTYKGSVVDALTQEVIPFATIAVYNANQELVDGTSTNNQGQFEFTTDKLFTYFEVTFIGYKTEIIQYTALDNPVNLLFNLRTIVSDLDEVVIQAERTTTQLKIDRKIINLGTDIQQSGTNALEAFDQIPDIQTDLGTGSISLRGNDNVRILINGKPSALNAVELLEQIPSSTIKSVEIITSPSAKYQADGLTGVINIILKSNTNKGTNLSLNSSFGTKRYGYGVTGNHNFSKVNLSFTGSQSGREMDSKQTINRVFNNGDTQNIFTPYDFNGLTRKLAGGVDYFINDNNELSVGLDYTDDYHSFYNTSQYFDVTNRDDFTYTRNAEHSHTTYVFNANYRKKFEKENHFLELDFNLNDNKNEYPASDFEDRVFIFDQEINENNKIHALSLDYSLPVTQTLQFEAGGSFNSSDIQNQRYIRLDTTDETLDTFKYSEELFGIYGLTKFTLKKIDWQLGLRYEYFTSNSTNTLNSEMTDLRFSNLFPSIHAAYKFNQNNTFSIGYSRRISRPNLHHVNPFQLGNPFFRFEGNSRLEPESSDNLEISYHKNKKSFNWSATTFYRYRKNIILWVNDIEDNNIQVISFQNKGINHSFGIESTMQIKLLNSWNTQFTGNYYFTKTEDNDIVTWDELYSSNLQLKNTFKITKSISTDITYRHTPKRQNPFNFIESRHRIDWGVRAKFLQNKFTANLRVIDVLDNNLMKRTTRTRDFEQRTIWKFQSQTLGFLCSLNYVLSKNKNKTRNRKKRKYRHNDGNN